MTIELSTIITPLLVIGVGGVLTLLGRLLWKVVVERSDMLEKKLDHVMENQDEMRTQLAKLQVEVDSLRSPWDNKRQHPNKP